MAVEFPVDIIMNDVSLDADAEIYTPEITTDDYSALANKPSINGNVLIGDKSTNDLGIDHVSFADNLVANSGVTSSSPYLFRRSPQNVSAKLHRLTGCTLAWNQYAVDGNFPDNTTAWSARLASVSISGGIATVTPSSDGTQRGLTQVATTDTPYVQEGHRYLLAVEVKPTITINVQFSCAGGGSVARSCSAGVWTKAAAIWTPPAATYRLNLYALAAGTLTTSQPIQYKNAQVFDLTAMFGPTIADAINTMETATAGSGVAFFRSLFPSAYYPYSAPALASVQTSARVARGFNQWDEEWRNGQYSTASATMGQFVANASYFANANPIPVIAGLTYNLRTGDNSTMRMFFYDSQMNFISRTDVTNSTFTIPSGAVYMNFCGVSTNYGSTYKYGITINISDTARNGEYEPYKSKTYPIDDVVLRGIPKLTNGQLEYDGDIYLPTGDVTRKYGSVDLGTLEWSYNSKYFTATLTGIKSAANWNTTGNLICAKYLASYGNAIDGETVDKAVACVPTANKVWVRDTAYTDKDTFTAAMSGVYLVYELATPTTESADPYAEIQMAGETEQFVCESVVPVGNEAFYPDDLTGVVQNLAPLPTTAGTYKLQVTVSGGVPSYSWVAG